MIYLGSDHAGYDLKSKIEKYLSEKGEKTVDLGVFAAEPPADYPDIAHEVAEKVSENADSRGILVCGTGIGMSMAANKIKGIRAANCESVGTVEMSRKHNNSNILCIGARVLNEANVFKMIDVFLSTAFENEERHAKRVDKIEKK